MLMLLSETLNPAKPVRRWEWGLVLFLLCLNTCYFDFLCSIPISSPLAHNDRFLDFSKLTGQPGLAFMQVLSAKAAFFYSFPALHWLGGAGRVVGVAVQSAWEFFLVRQVLRLVFSLRAKFLGGNSHSKNIPRLLEGVEPDSSREIRVPKWLGISRFGMGLIIILAVVNLCFLDYLNGLGMEGPGVYHNFLVWLIGQPGLHWLAQPGWMVMNATRSFFGMFDNGKAPGLGWLANGDLAFGVLIQTLLHFGIICGILKLIGYKRLTHWLK